MTICGLDGETLGTYEINAGTVADLCAKLAKDIYGRLRVALLVYSMYIGRRIPNEEFVLAKGQSVCHTYWSFRNLGVPYFAWGP